MASSSRSWVIAALGASAALLACNAILGVEDVKLKAQRAPFDGGPTGDDDDDGAVQGDGSVPPTDTPHPIIALGYNHGCARMLDSTVVCWGDNGGGELGDNIPFDGGTRGPALRPQLVPDVKDAVTIAAGLSHVCAVRATGKIACWGVNGFGQLGDGTTTRSSKPVEVIGITDAVAVAGGNSTTCALHANKSVSCWGINNSGQLGDGTLKDSAKPVLVKGLTNAIAVAAAADHSCAIVEGGDVMCWGGNKTGQLGIGSLASAPAPTKLTALSDIAQIATAQNFSCARAKAGRVYCWGSNDKGELGNGTATAEPNPSPVLVSSLTDATFIWTGFEHACAVRQNGTIVCWGFAGQGQMGAGVVLPDASAPQPIAVKGLTGAIAVWTGGDRACAVTSDQGFCWGSNTLGQLGNGTTDRAYTPTPIAGFP